MVSASDGAGPGESGRAVASGRDIFLGFSLPSPSSPSSPSSLLAPVTKQERGFMGVSPATRRGLGGRNITAPAMLPLPPLKFGCAATGSPRSDGWRLILSVGLLIPLVGLPAPDIGLCTLTIGLLPLPPPPTLELLVLSVRPAALYGGLFVPFVERLRPEGLAVLTK